MSSALKYWELDNNIELVDPKRDALFAYDPDTYPQSIKHKPWRTDPRYFKRVRISAIALIKMVMHARSGGSLEVMGLMQGYVDGDSFIVTDAYRLPVEGTETRVNAHTEAEEYLVEYLRLSREQGARQENAVGWYHSHPGYGCWLSGIDVGTQLQQQQFNEPFLAVVIDPDRTINSGKVEIGAFRTLPPKVEGGPEDAGPSKIAVEVDTGDKAAASSARSSIPLDKANEFGAHADKYYSLEVSHFKSTLDAHLLELLWDKYWVQTLSQSPLFASRDFSNKQLRDLAGRVNGVESQLDRTQSMTRPGNPYLKKPVDVLIEKLAAESGAVTMRERAGLMALDVKSNVFGGSFVGQQTENQGSS